MELFLGKVLAAVIPAIGLSWLSYLVYIIVVNAASYPLFGRIWFPLATWWPLMFWLTPALAVLGISATVLISSRVKTFMEAYQLSASLVVLVLALVIGQSERYPVFRSCHRDGDWVTRLAGGCCVDLPEREQIQTQRVDC